MRIRDAGALLLFMHHLFAVITLRGLIASTALGHQPATVCVLTVFVLSRLHSSTTIAITMNQNHQQQLAKG